MIKNFSKRFHNNICIRFIRSHFRFLIVLVLLVCAVYANAINNQFVSDDIGTISANPDVGTFQSIFKQPVVFTQNLFYAIVFHISGLAPAGFRLLNILFHLGSVLTLYAILYLQLRKKEVAFFAAAIFAVHPLLIESVTWISGGNYVRYSFFFLFSFLAYLLSRKNTTWYVISLVSLLLSIFSSEKAIVLPIMFFIYELFLIPKGERSWKRLMPYLAGLVLWGVFYMSKLAERTATLYTSNYGIGRGLYNPLNQIPTAISSYLQLIFWPSQLSYYHTELLFPHWNFALRVLVTIFFFLCLVFFFKKDKFVFFWLVLFFVSLIPTLLPIPIAWIVAERYSYLGTAGIIVAVTYLAFKLAKSNLQQKILMGVLVVMLALLSYRTVIRNIDWSDEEHLWIATGKTAPSSADNHNNLGALYLRTGRMKAAEVELKKAVAMEPHYGDAYYNLGLLYLQTGNIPAAIKNYNIAYNQNPRLWSAMYEIAKIYFDQHQYEKSLEYIKKALNASPNNPEISNNMGYIYFQLNDIEMAKQAFQYTLSIDPGNIDAQLVLLELSQPGK